VGGSLWAALHGVGAAVKQSQRAAAERMRAAALRRRGGFV